MFRSFMLLTLTLYVYLSISFLLPRHFSRKMCSRRLSIDSRRLFIDEDIDLDIFLDDNDDDSIKASREEQVMKCGGNYVIFNEIAKVSASGLIEEMTR